MGTTLQMTVQQEEPSDDRPRQPWEASDGCVLLVRELAAVAPAAAPQFLSIVAELAALDGFAHCCHLQASRAP